MYKYFL